ncbi:J domain-containing protein [Sporobolomyces salmoneus]|uniref:J domain-containing protein n=1 Tax=Sporobolomyces salmoneus TaxID=183962 RepID=UPI0031719EDD
MSFPSASTSTELPWDQQEPLFGSHASRLDQEDYEESPLAGPSEGSLYSILNLSNDCTEEEIQKSYRRLAALLHPDRHRDPALKKAADSRFQAINHAFEVLSDPQKRVIYDELGEDGLKSELKVGPRGKTAQELRAEYEKLNRQQLEANLESLVRSRGEITITSDARVMLLSDEERIKYGGPQDFGLIDRIQSVSTRQLFLKHSFTTPINPATALILTSQIVARQGVGAGNFIVKLQHNPTSRLNFEIGTTLLRPRALTFKTTYAPDPDSFARLELLPIRSLAFPQPPKFTLTLGRRIYENLTAILTLRSGSYSLGPWGASTAQPVSDSTLSVGLQHTNGLAVECTSGVFTQQLSGGWGTTVLSGFKVGLNGVVTSTGAMSVGWNVDRRVTENVKTGLGLDVGVNGAMTLKIRIMRLGQRITLPIIVSTSFDPRLFTTLTVIPAIGIITTNHFLLAPRKQRKLSSKLKELRREHEEYIREKREEAVQAQELVKEYVAKRVKEEESRNGLIIDEAIYGVLQSVDEKVESELEQRWFDVTLALQALLPAQSSQLVIPAGRTKASLLGFYDPAIGEKKQLKVRYRFKGKLHEAILGDKQAVALPLREHIVGP